MKPLDEDFNTPQRPGAPGPKEARGGVLALADIKVIKQALGWYVNTCQGQTDMDERHIANLLHRLGRIG